MVCKNSSHPYIASLVPSGSLQPSWQTVLPSCRPGILFCLTHPSTTASWVLIAESSLPGMIETIKRTQLNFSHPAGWAQGRALLFLPLPPPSNYPWYMCGLASAGSFGQLIDVTSLLPWTPLSEGGLMTKISMPGLPAAVDTWASFLYLPT